MSAAHEMLSGAAAKSREPPPTLETMPTEMIQAILEYVNVDTLQDFRLTCRPLARDSRPLLVSNINVTETSESFRRLLHLCRQGDEITSSIRSLTYLPFTLEGARFNRPAWEQKIEYARLPEIFQNFSSFGEYENVIQDRLDMAINKSNIKFLVEALGYIKPLSINIVLFNYMQYSSFTSIYHVAQKHALFLQTYRPWKYQT